MGDFTKYQGESSWFDNGYHLDSLMARGFNGGKSNLFQYASLMDVRSESCVRPSSDFVDVQEN